MVAKTYNTGERYKVKSRRDGGTEVDTEMQVDDEVELAEANTRM